MKPKRVREPRIPTLKGLGASRAAACTAFFDQAGKKLHLSPTQCAVFPTGGILGVGASATAYEHADDPRKVVKFTFDANDAKAAAILKGKTLKGAAKVYEVAKLDGVIAMRDGKRQPVYAIVTEKLKTLDRGPTVTKLAVRAFNTELGVLDMDNDLNQYGLLQPGPGFKFHDTFIDEAVQACDMELFKAGYFDDATTCGTVIPELAEAVEEVGKRGGIFTSDLHSGNWGTRKDGTLAILDFGESRASRDSERPVESLAKAPARRKRRRG
jgi:hypothetical protein